MLFSIILGVKKIISDIAETLQLHVWEDSDIEISTNKFFWLSASVAQVIPKHCPRLIDL